MILVGNKIDLQHERKIQRKSAAAEASSLGIKYFEVSAKTSSKDEIDLIFLELIEGNEMSRYDITPKKTSNFLPCSACDGSSCGIM